MQTMNNPQFEGCSTVPESIPLHTNSRGIDVVVGQRVDGVGVGVGVEVHLYKNAYKILIQIIQW